MPSYDAADLETTACPLCAGLEHRALHRFEPFGVARCLGCGLAFLQPRLKEARMRQVYASGEYFEDYTQSEMDYQAQAQGLRATFRRMLRLAARRGLTGGRLLEVGSAYGYLLDEARPHFQYRAGVDFSPAAVARTAQVADSAWEGGLDQVPASAGKFDALIGANVLEHVYEPGAFLRQSLGLLVPKGVVMMATPRFDGLWYKALGPKWASFKIPEHVTYWKPETLVQLFKGSGLEGVGTFTFGHAFPLGLILAKLKLPVPGLLKAQVVWLPDVMVAAYGRKPA